MGTILCIQEVNTLRKEKDLNEVRHKDIRREESKHNEPVTCPNALLGVY